MIEFFRLSHLGEERAGGLSYGQQKLLDCAMAFVAGPRLVLLEGGLREHWEQLG